jgi:hypothetical protein
MKAVSIRQPWASMVMGLLPGLEKSYEIRSWVPNIPLPARLAIHASLQVDESACRRFHLRPDVLPSGFVLGTADLVEVKHYTSWADFIDDGPKHFNDPDSFKVGLNAWVFKDPRPFIVPVPARGQLNIFDVPLPVFLL